MTMNTASDVIAAVYKKCRKCYKYYSYECVSNEKFGTHFLLRKNINKEKSMERGMVSKYNYINSLR